MDLPLYNPSLFQRRASTTQLLPASREHLCFHHATPDSTRRLLHQGFLQGPLCQCGRCLNYRTFSPACPWAKGGVQRRTYNFLIVLCSSCVTCAFALQWNFTRANNNDWKIARNQFVLGTRNLELAAVTNGNRTWITAGSRYVYHHTVLL
jgi:hypothetical protein